MNIKYALFFMAPVALALTGCAHYNAQPYTVSTDNQVAIKQAAKETGASPVSLGTVTLKAGVSPDLNCRAAGPVNAAPGKTVPQYIEEALKTELYQGGIYEPNAKNRIDAQVTALGFSSGITDANWTMGMHLTSKSMPEGFNADIQYPFSASFIADSACKSVADAFAPAVQRLVNKIVSGAEFKQLIKP